MLYIHYAADGNVITWIGRGNRDFIDAWSDSIKVHRLAVISGISKSFRLTRSWRCLTYCPCRPLTLGLRIMSSSFLNRWSPLFESGVLFSGACRHRNHLPFGVEFSGLGGEFNSKVYSLLGGVYCCRRDRFCGETAFPPVVNVLDPGGYFQTTPIPR